jgi:hypothetical protein
MCFVLCAVEQHIWIACAFCFAEELLLLTLHQCVFYLGSNSAWQQAVLLFSGGGFAGICPCEAAHGVHVVLGSFLLTKSVQTDALGIEGSWNRAT